MKKDAEDIHKPIEKDVVIENFAKCSLVTQEFPNKVEIFVLLFVYILKGCRSAICT
jgi:hypothetical protein